MANKAVALVLGQGPGNAVKKSIEKDLDNYRFMIFDSLPQMIKSSEENEQFYSKIIVYELRLTDTFVKPAPVLVDEEDNRVEALNDLVVYLNSHSSTEVVVLCDTGDKFTKVSDYIDEYVNMPTVTPILPPGTQPVVFKFCASNGISEIRSRYYTQDKKKARIRTVKQSEVEPDTKKSVFGRRGKKSKAVEQQEPEEQMNAAQDSNEDYSDDSEFAGPAGDLGLSDVAGFAGTAASSAASQGAWGQEAAVGAVSQGIAGGMGSLSFGDAGSNHEETGFLDEAEEFDVPAPPKPISQPVVEMPESGGFSQYSPLPDNSGNFGDVPAYSSLPTEGGPLPGVGEFGGFIPPLIPETSSYEVAQPVYDTEYGGDVSTPSAYGGAAYPDSDEESGNEPDDSPEILDRIILVTGDRGSGVTTKAAELAIEAAEAGSGKVLYIDLDFRKHGVLGLLDDFAGFIKSGPHSIVSGKPYVEGGLEVLSDGHGARKTTAAIEWVEDSRNYANYSKIIIDCPLEFVSDLGTFVSTVGIVYLVDGSQSGLMGTISVLDNRDSINNEVALTFRDKGLFCVIRKEDNYRESLAKLKGEVAIDRVDWLAKIV